MAYELKDGQGSLFVNDRKQQDNHPDRTGKAMIGGVMYDVSGWLKEGRRGKWLSLSFRPAREKGEQIGRDGRRHGPPQDDDPGF